MSETEITITIIVIIVVLVGGAAFFWLAKSDSSAIAPVRVVISSPPATAPASGSVTPTTLPAMRSPTARPPRSEYLDRREQGVAP